MTQNTKKSMTNTKKLTGLAMFAALAYAIMLVGRIPIVLFLKYDPKDFVLLIAAFIYGIVPAGIVTVIVCVLETLTASDTGIIGLFMNIVATFAFLLPANYAFRKNKDTKNVIIGLVISTFFMTAIMILWNWVVTPFYMHVPRAEVVKLLVPAIIPFNIIKGFANSALTLIFYRKILKVRADFFEQGDADKEVTLRDTILSAGALAIIALAMYFLIR